MQEKIIILDFGSQTTQLIGRRVRELNMYCEIVPYNKFPHDDPSVIGVILSGSPFSVYDESAFKVDLSNIRGKYPILGICYGAQLMSYLLGGEVATAPVSEYGKTEVEVDTTSKLYEGVSPKTICWMSHTDYISKMPEQSVLRLSDAYERKSEELDLELRIRFININPGYNEEIVEKSPTLYQYVKFVDIVRKYQQEMPFPEAVEKGCRLPSDRTT